jgi:hypothetical protein
METMARLASWVVLAGLVSGCAEPAKKFTLVGFDDTEADIALDASARWCRTGAYCPTVTELVEWIGTNDSGQVKSGLTVGRLDATPDGMTTIYVLDRRTHPDWPRLLRGTLMHELGHAATGCEEHLPVGNIMEPADSQVTEPTNADVEYVLTR